MEVVKKYCSGKKHREAGRYSQLCQSSTKVRCIPKAKKSPNCWLLEELEGREQFMLPTFFTPSCFHLLLVSIRNLDGCSAFNNNMWLQLYFEYHPRKTSSCHVGRFPPPWIPSKSLTNLSICFPGLPGHISVLSLELPWVTIMIFAQVRIGVPILRSRSSQRFLWSRAGQRATWTDPREA